MNQNNICQEGSGIKNCYKGVYVHKSTQWAKHPMGPPSIQQSKVENGKVKY